MAINPQTGKEENPVTTGSLTGNIQQNEIKMPVFDNLVKSTEAQTNAQSYKANASGFTTTNDGGNSIGVPIGGNTPTIPKIEPIKVETPAVTTPNVNADLNAKGYTSTGFSTGAPTIPAVTGTTGTTGIGEIIKPQVISNVTANKDNIGIITGVNDDITGTIPLTQKYTLPDGTIADPNDADPTKASNARRLITEYNQNKVNENKAIKDQIGSYIKNGEEYAKEKENYVNYDTIETQHKGVIDDLTAFYRQNPGATITDQQKQAIASKNGVTVDEVTNPTNIYNKFELSTVGQEKKGVTKWNEQQTQNKTALDRQKADLQTNLDNSLTNINNQIDDVQTQLTRNLNFMEASGVWSGAMKSSGYVQGMANVKSDGQKTIDRLRAMASNLKNAKDTDVSRLQADYDSTLTRAKTDFDTQLKDLNQNVGTQMSTLTATYGIGSNELSKALENVTKTYGANSIKIMTDYQTMLKTATEATNATLTLKENQLKLDDTIANKRFNDYNATDGKLLASTSLKTIMQDVIDGKLTYQKADDLRNVMISNISTALSKMGTVNESDINTITHQLEAGKTPTQILAFMQNTGKFIKKDDFKDNYEALSDGNYYDKNTKQIISKDDMYNKINNQSAQETTAPVTTIDTNAITAFSEKKRGTENLQCGQLVNDYILKETGIDPAGNARFVDLYKSKLTALNTIGKSDTPVAGGIFVMDTGSSTGHTGIVQSVNADGSITVLEANAQGQANGQPPVTTTYSPAQMLKMQFSKSISKNVSNINVTSGVKGNIPDRNNNPGNLKMGDIGKGIDAQGHTIFPDATAGFNALIKDLTNKSIGNTTTGLNSESTLAQLGKKYATDPNWANNVSSISGISLDTKMKDMDIYKLATGIAKAEGFSGTISKNVPTTTTQIGGTKTYTNTQKNILNQLDPKNLTATDYKTLANNGLKDSDLFNFKASKGTGNIESGYDSNLSPSYEKYLNDGTLPTGLQLGTTPGNEFIKNANEWKKSQQQDSGKYTYDIDTLDSYARYGKNAQLTSGRPVSGKEMLEFDSQVRKYAKENGIDTNPNTVKARANMYTEWNSTKPNSTGSSIAAIDTVTQHMDEYKNAVKDYNTLGLPALNRLATSLGYQVGGDAKQVLNQITVALANEMRNVYGGKSEGEVNAWKESVPKEANELQALAWVNEAKKLISGRVKSLNNQWYQNFREDNQNLLDISERNGLNLGKTIPKTTSSGKPIITGKNPTTGPLAPAKDPNGLFSNLK